ncbi:uncharacterized protein LOC126692751 isoform X2 [Quercus robur]|uniref:uncharacterized protein LOC126692751 isoform X2 n=1 Tax=Quercus robur TaxID=38942 RepID=UPI002161DCA9|nr:uncharacterized protein LOC126692751 isoform X2 [Quercus robur]
MVVSDANLVLYVEEQFNPSPRYLDSSLGGLYSISLEISQMSKFCLNGDSIFVYRLAIATAALAAGATTKVSSIGRHFLQNTVKDWEPFY